MATVAYQRNTAHASSKQPTAWCAAKTCAPTCNGRYCATAIRRWPMRSTTINRLLACLRVNFPQVWSESPHVGGSAQSSASPALPFPITRPARLQAPCQQCLQAAGSSANTPVLHNEICSLRNVIVEMRDCAASISADTRSTSQFLTSIRIEPVAPQSLPSEDPSFPHSAELTALVKAINRCTNVLCRIEAEGLGGIS